jgi:hypothetical protein
VTFGAASRIPEQDQRYDVAFSRLDYAVMKHVLKHLGDDRRKVFGLV